MDCYKMENERELVDALMALLDEVDVPSSRKSIDIKRGQLSCAETPMEALGNFFCNTVYPAGLSQHSLEYYAKRIRVIEANYLALFAAEKQPDRVTLLDGIEVRNDTLESGDLFVWCGEIMYLKGRDTYTINDNSLYKSFVFNFENEPSYLVGKMKSCD